MKTTNRTYSGNSHDAIAAVRALIEREFASLHQQQPRVLQLALNEAEAIAWQTGFPHLLFPLLAMEKAQAAASWLARQTSIQRGQPILAFAA
jgi:exonuclease I